MEVDVGQPPHCQALGKYRGASLLRAEANGSLPAKLILREPGAASRRKAATAGSKTTISVRRSLIADDSR